MHPPSQLPAGELSGFTTPPGRRAVLVADPHCCVREGLRTILGREPDLCVVAEAADAVAALSLATELNPDVVVLDAHLPGFGGPQVVSRLLQGGPDRGVLVLTGCEDAGAARLCLGAGARGYVLKRSAPDRLVRAVRAVAAGGTFVDPEVAGPILAPAAGSPATDLSEREAEVVRLIALGYSNKEIAARLSVSVKTVETYKSRAMEKLKCRGCVDLVRYSAARGWLSEEGSRPGQFGVA